ncbi:MAG: VWA domain-containing protein [Hyphomicrobiales bacterium]|nr:VWA domain-containing protein [Hyphomicrobiales bacterium]
MSDESGAVAVIFALALVPLLIVAGGAIDYTAAMYEKSVLQNAADAGVLAGATTARNAVGASDASWKQASASSSASVFQTNLSSRIRSDVVSQATSFSLGATTIDGALTISAQVPTSFLKLIGIKQINIAATSSASVSTKKFTDIHLVVDTSNSMGIGATVADQTALYNQTGCQVACHYNGGASHPDDLAVARSIGVTLRLDVVKQALTKALASLPTDGTTRVAVYSLGNTLTTTFPLSADIPGAINAVNALDLAQANAQGGTNIGYSLQQLASQLQTAGSGVAATSPSGVLILATDAIEDETIIYQSGGSNSWVADPNFVVNPVSVLDGSGFHFQTLNPANCQSVKDKGYNVFTLEVAYIIPRPVDSWYNTRLDFIRNTLLPTQVPDAMSQCASSPNQYLHAETSADIVTAMTRLIPANSGLRLTR